MATGSSIKTPCCKCEKGSGTLICHGCHQSFCLKHVNEHRQELSQQMDNIGQQHDILRRDLSQQNINKTLLEQVDRWEQESMEKIQSSAKEIRADLKRLTEESTNRLSNFMDKLSDELRLSREKDEYTEDDLDRWMKQLEEFQKEMEEPSEIELSEDRSSFLYFIKIQNPNERQKNKSDSNFQNVDHSDEKSKEDFMTNILLQDECSTITSTQLYSQSAVYPNVVFGLNQLNDQSIGTLFEHLMHLYPMDKNGPMKGKCSPQTDQMEQFLFETFAFKNIPKQYIVQGVKSFRLGKYPDRLSPDTVIYFPKASTNSFMMTAKEIMDWQRSYTVYASKDIEGIEKEFLYRALQGQCQDGEETFRMKFVVRISTCPILMEFDGKVIPRKLNEDWPHRIKLVSVTGIDFAGRKHNVDDIRCYISNWREVFDIDPKSDLPLVHNERYFCPKINGPPAQLHEERVYDSLMRMAELRLRACDEEGVQIVVESIGLGVFAGHHIRTNGKVRALSAEAIRTVLQRDGSSYKNIRAVVFALPKFNKSRSNTPVFDTFDCFVDQFNKSRYDGPIPVLITDQDMHRLTVSIARQGFIVSELNPADSHGVFGAYWQNREPTVEEKVALTTIGLLVQHHLINPHVLDRNKYHLLQVNERKTMDWLPAIPHNNETMVTSTCRNQ